jgi:hypothetical protein
MWTRTSVALFLVAVLLLFPFLAAGHAAESTIDIDSGASIETTGSADVCADSKTGDGTFSGSWCGSTLVYLVSFSAIHEGNHVRLKWATASEFDNAGFHLWRSESDGGSYERITQNLIPAAGGSALGAEYMLEDTEVGRGTSYWYKLEDIDFGGDRTFHWPVCALPGSGFGCALSGERGGGGVSSGGLCVMTMALPVLLAIGTLRRKWAAMSSDEGKKTRT